MSILRSRPTFLLIFLVGLTGVSWWIGHALHAWNSQVVRALILVIAFIKVRIIVLDFMELRHAPLVLRSVAEVWVVGMGATLVVLLMRTTAT